MRSSFMGFEVQKRSLQMAQKSLDITAHNLGNRGTPGFTRQRVDVSSLHISSFTYWQTKLSRLSLAGQGVTAFGVSQIRNDYLDKRYRDMAPFAREYDVKVKIMQEIETTLDGIDNFGLLDAFNNLRSALQQVSLSQPDAKEMTSLVRNQAVNICAMLRSYHTDLTRLLENNIVELQNNIEAANILIDKIVEYNKQITGEYILDSDRITKGQGVSEYGPLELLDARNLLLDELAEFGNIEVVRNVNGSVRVTMAGVTIIDDQESKKIRMREYSDFNAAVLTFSDGTEFRPSTGLLKGYVDMLSGNGSYAVGRYQNSEFGIPYYLQALDAFAQGFAAIMNGTNHANNNIENTWDRSLIWGGFEVDANGDRVIVNGSYVRLPVTAANIRVTDEWLDNELMIGETFLANAIQSYRPGSHTVGSVFLDTSTMTYYMVAGTNTNDPITGANVFNSAEMSIADAVQGGFIRQIDVFSPNTVVPEHTNTRTFRQGELFLDPRTNVYFRTTSAYTVGANGVGAPITDINSAREAGLIEVVGINQGSWQAANLDGANLHRFVQALEDPRQWGRALDFHGSAFEYLMFLSNRMAQGIDFVEKQFDMTMDTINTLLDNRDAISAVCETEEGIQMMTYQKWFNASARLMTTMDEALDTLINRMGRVGL
jgi:flagellar hook-associated protein 1 FlgK